MIAQRKNYAKTKSDIFFEVYLYSYVKTIGGAITSARQLLELIKGYKLSYSIAFYIEDKLYTKMSKVENIAIATAFLNEIEIAKYYGVVYTYTYFANIYLNMVSLLDC